MFCTLYSAANALSRIPAPGRLFTTSAVVFAFTVSDIKENKNKLVLLKLVMLFYSRLQFKSIPEYATHQEYSFENCVILFCIGFH